MRRLDAGDCAARKYKLPTILAWLLCRVRLRGKGAHKDTLFFKRDFEVAAAEYMAKESGTKQRALEVGPQLSPAWHKLRDARLTASTFGNALG